MTSNSKYDKYNKSHKGRYRGLKATASKRGLELTINLEQFKEILRGESCFYCKSALGSSGYGLDRVDNNKGYTPDNVVACCTECNFIKGDRLTHVEMIAVALLLKKMRADEQA